MWYSKTRNLIRFVRDRKGHDFRYAINNKKIYKKIKWRPKTLFKKGLEDTINFYIKNHKKLKKIFPYGWSKINFPKNEAQDFIIRF